MDEKSIYTARSTYSRSELAEFRKIFDVPTCVKMSIPSRLQNAREPPAGMVSVYAAFFEKCGLRFPLTKFFCGVLSHYGIHFTQLSPKAVRVLIGFVDLCRASTVLPEVDLFRYFYRLAPESNDWYSFSLRRGGNDGFFDGFNVSEDWMSRFFFIDVSPYFPGDLKWQSLGSRDPSPSPGKYDESSVMCLRHRIEKFPADTSTYERLKERDYFKRIERHCDGQAKGEDLKPLKRKVAHQKAKKSVRRVLNVDSSEDEGGKYGVKHKLDKRSISNKKERVEAVSLFSFSPKRSRSSLTSAGPSSKKPLITGARMVEWLEKVLPPADEKKLLAEDKTGAELVLQAARTFVANNTICSRKDRELEECKQELEKERKLKAKAERKAETMQRRCGTLDDRVKNLELERGYIFKEGFKGVCYKLLNSYEFSGRMADALEANEHCIRSQNSKGSNDALKVTLGMVQHKEYGFLDDINQEMSLDSLKAWSPPDGDRPGMKKWLFL